MTTDEKDRLIEIMRQNIAEKEKYIHGLIRENIKLKGKGHTLKGGKGHDRQIKSEPSISEGDCLQTMRQGQGCSGVGAATDPPAGNGGNIKRLKEGRP